MEGIKNMRRRILITGGCGFIGSHMVLHIVKNYSDYFVLNLDKMDYCASEIILESIKDKPNYNFVKGDILNSDLLSHLLKAYSIDVVMHFAAQTHVDNSFGNSLSFSVNNIVGTHTLLECCRQYQNIERFIYISTDEVYGESAFSMERALERQTLLPTNPYAATKAGAEHIVLSYYKSWQFPVILTRSNNIYGPHQYPEKVIPKWICLLNRNLPCPLHGDGSHKRAYLYIDDVIAAFDLILHKGVKGEVYNISSSFELTNKELSHIMIKMYNHDDVDKWIVNVEDRAYNDMRYHIDGSKMNALGWKESVSFEDGLLRTMEWYKNVDIESIWGPAALAALHKFGVVEGSVNLGPSTYTYQKHE